LGQIIRAVPDGDEFAANPERSRRARASKRVCAHRAQDAMITADITGATAPYRTS
jgi:hypothetical protein